MAVCLYVCLYARSMYRVLSVCSAREQTTWPTSIKPQQTYQLGQINARYWFKTFQSKFPVWSKTSKNRFVLRNGFKNFIKLIQKYRNTEKLFPVLNAFRLHVYAKISVHIVKTHTACLLICIKNCAIANALFNITINFRKANTYIIWNR